MVVAVVSVRMVQMSLHQMIDVITVRHLLVAAVGAMDVTFFVTVAAVLRCARSRIRRAYLQRVLLNAFSLRVVQTPVL